MSQTSRLSALIEAAPGPLRDAFGARVSQLLQGTRVPRRDDLTAAGRRAYAEITGDPDVTRSIVETWPEERRRRLARRVKDLSGAGFAPPDADHLAFVQTVSEEDFGRMTPFDVASLTPALP